MTGWSGWKVKSKPRTTFPMMNIECITFNMLVMGGRPGNGANANMGSGSRSGKFTGSNGDVFYNGPGSKGWNQSVEKAVNAGVKGNKNAVYMMNDEDDEHGYTVLAGVAAKSTGYQKDIATKGLNNLYNNKFGSYGSGLTEKQAWAVAYEFQRIYGKK